MALSRALQTLCVLLFAALAAAKTVTYDFNITWVLRNPDGLKLRPVMGINNQWPVPRMEAMKGDRVVVNVHNQLGNQSTSLHFHGLFQNGSSQMDGAVGATQCPIPPGFRFTYDFTVDQAGTYWYHSHHNGQYPDGLRGPFIIHDTQNPPYINNIDGEMIIPLSDWYHEQQAVLLPQFISVTNPRGAEPVPNAALMNDSQNVKYPVQPGKTYLFRIINTGALAGQYFWFENHTMQIVEVDGVWTEPQNAQKIYVAVAQRYGVLVTMKNDASANFAITGSMDQELFDVVPPTLNPNCTGWLAYNDKKPFNPAPFVDSFEDTYDDFYLLPYDKLPLLENPTQSIELTMKMGNLGNGANYAFINDKTYVGPKVPTIYSALTTGNWSTDATVYGHHTNSFVLRHNEVVEIVLNNDDPGKHPFHLHGHNFQAIFRSAPNAGYYSNPANATRGAHVPAVPMRRDTFMVRPYGNYAIRFRSNNPGVWLFHCHIEWHVAAGLSATLVEAPLALQRTLVVPADHYAACRAQAQPTAGNAAANTQNYLDLAGEPAPPAPLPAGFTARGIVAIVFSGVCAVLGVAVIAWYGAAPIGSAEFAAAKKKIEEAGIDVDDLVRASVGGAGVGAGQQPPVVVG